MTETDQIIGKKQPPYCLEDKMILKEKKKIFSSSHEDILELWGDNFKEIQIYTFFFFASKANSIGNTIFFCYFGYHPVDNLTLGLALRICVIRKHLDVFLPPASTQGPDVALQIWPFIEHQLFSVWKQTYTPSLSVQPSHLGEPLSVYTFIHN